MRRFLILTIPLLWLTIGCKKKEDIPEQPRPVKYERVKKITGAELHTFSGSSRSSKESSLSFKVPGTIKEIYVKVGDRVNKRDSIATLDPDDYDIALQQSVANQKSVETRITGAKSKLVSAKSNYERVEKLYENNSVSLNEFEQAKSQYEASKSEYEATLAEATAAGKKTQGALNEVHYTHLLAPFDGVITEKIAEENEEVASGNAIAVLSDLDQPEVIVGLPEIFIHKVSENQKVSIKFSVIPQRAFTGTVHEISFATGKLSTYPITIRIHDSTGMVRPGLAANVTFDFAADKEKKAPSMIIAPVEAVAQGPDGNFVFVLQPTENSNIYRVEKRNVKIQGLIREGYSITNRLNEGEILATAGLSTLLDGMNVVLLDEQE